MENTAQAGQGSVPRRGLPERLPCCSNAPARAVKEPSAPSPAQDSATSFPTGKCLRGWEGAGSKHVISLPWGPHTCGWRQMFAAGPGRMLGAGGAAKSVRAACSMKQWLFWEGESDCGAVTAHSSPSDTQGKALGPARVIAFPKNEKKAPLHLAGPSKPPRQGWGCTAHGDGTW